MLRILSTIIPEHRHTIAEVMIQLFKTPIMVSTGCIKCNYILWTFYKTNDQWSIQNWDIFSYYSPKKKLTRTLTQSTSLHGVSNNLSHITIYAHDTLTAAMYS